MMRKVLIVSIAVFLRKNVFDQTYCSNVFHFSNYCITFSIV